MITSKLQFVRISTRAFASNEIEGTSIFAKFAKSLATTPWLAAARKATIQGITSTSTTMVTVETTGMDTTTTKTGGHTTKKITKKSSDKIIRIKTSKSPIFWVTKIKNFSNGSLLKPLT